MSKMGIKDEGKSGKRMDVRTVEKVLKEGRKVCCLRSSRRDDRVQCITAATDERQTEGMNRQKQERREVHPWRVSGSEKQ